MVLARAEAVLNRVDQILLDARARARQEQEERGDNGGMMLENDPDPQAGGAQSKDEGNSDEEEAKPSDAAEGQISSDLPTGKTRPAQGYEKDDDIVTRQICELAEREKDPDVRKQLEKKCKSLRDS